MLRFSALVITLLAFAVGCDVARPRNVVGRRLLDMGEVDAEGMGRLDGVVLRSQSPPEVRDVAVHGDRRPSLVLGTPARIAFRGGNDAQTMFRFGLAVRPPDAEVMLKLTVNGEPVYEEAWQEERDWAERELALPANGRDTELELSFEGEGAEVMLAHPELLRAAKDDRPNVIVYVVDCLRADHVGAYGYERPTTPAIDALAKDSVVLEDLTACAPWTKPSTACLFTSLLPIYHGARTVDDALAPERTTLAEAFAAAGYVTAAWVANPVIDPRLFLFNQGYDRWVDVRSFEERTERAHVNAVEGDAADITAGVLPWLDEHRDDHFFLYLHSLDLHFGYRPRPPFDRIFVSQTSSGIDRERELYDNELAYNDREIGKLAEHLKTLGLYDETILFVTADHGEEFGEHGQIRHGKTLYQQVLHIPGILKLPDSRLAGERLAAVVSNVDVPPTLLQLAGVDAPSVFQGRSLGAAIDKGAGESGRRVFAELVAPKFVSYAVRDERYKYVKNLAPEPSDYLFDLEGDPAEKKNLLPDAPSEAAELVPEIERFVQLGQNGLHVSVRGARKGARVKLRARTGGEAAIVRAFRFAMATGDTMELSPERRELELSFTVDEAPRHLVLQTEPAGAPLTLSLSSDGHLVETRDVEPSEVAVSLVEAEQRMNEGASDGLRVFYVPFTEGRNPVALDDEATRNLRALGYIQ